MEEGVFSDLSAIGDRGLSILRDTGRPWEVGVAISPHSEVGGAVLVVKETGGTA